jgi:1-acyl-sn-glycerol-3-phosphate acyltransferase
MDPAGSRAVKSAVYRLLEWVTRTLLLAFFDYRSVGRGNVPREGGTILACTHQSHLDPVLVVAPVDRVVKFVARSTLFANRGFALLIGTLGAMAFDRDEGGAGELRGVLRALGAGDALVFFPEGTRSPDGEIGPLKPGVALLASRSGVPVVPVALSGTYQCWPRWRKVFRPGRVRVVYGEPVRYDRGMDRDEVLRDLDRRIRAAWDAARSAC